MTLLDFSMFLERVELRGGGWRNAFGQTDLLEWSNDIASEWRKNW